MSVFVVAEEHIRELALFTVGRASGFTSYRLRVEPVDLIERVSAEMTARLHDAEQIALIEGRDSRLEVATVYADVLYQAKRSTSYTMCQRLTA